MELWQNSVEKDFRFDVSDDVTINIRVVRGFSQTLKIICTVRYAMCVHPQRTIKKQMKDKEKSICTEFWPYAYTQFITFDSLDSKWKIDLQIFSHSYFLFVFFFFSLLRSDLFYCHVNRYNFTSTYARSPLRYYLNQKQKTNSEFLVNIYSLVTPHNYSATLLLSHSAYIKIR